MSNSCTDNKEVMSAENGLQLNAVHDAAVKDEVFKSPFTHIACIFCDISAASAVESVRVLPCLHVACQSCLMQFLTDRSSPQEGDGEFAALVFSCPRCSSMIQLPCNGVSGLSMACFLQSASSRVAVSKSAALVTDGVDNPALSTALPAVASPSADGYKCLSSDTLPLVDSETQTACRTVAASAKCSVRCSQTENNGADITTSLGARCSDECGVYRVHSDDMDSMKSKLHHLSVDAQSRERQCQQAVQQIELVASDLDGRKTAVHDAIGRRADHLCRLIYARRDQLFDELEREHSSCSREYKRKTDVLDAYSRHLRDSCEFAGAVLCADGVGDDLHGDVLVRLKQLLLSDIDTSSTVPELTALRVDVPDMQHEESHLERLFGGLVKGTLGTVDLLTSFSTELQWPTGFVVTTGRESVLAGKAGAFAKEGQVLFYDRSGVCIHRHCLPSSHLPVDVVALASGDVLVSDVSGHITKFTPAGCLVNEWKDKFQGTSGHMAVSGSGDKVLVSSASECCIHRYGSVDGRWLGTFALQWPDTKPPDLTAIAVNSANEIIVTASNVSGPCFFSHDGQLLRRCSATVTSDDVKTLADNGLRAALIALPSALCCDPFDNVLIADFLGNCVHLVSRLGVYLGQLLTKSHGVACPNFVTLDHEGRLYVGQYGGDVLVFQYLSYVKHV